MYEKIYQNVDLNWLGTAWGCERVSLFTSMVIAKMYMEYFE